jgi:hypothetical protein
MASTEYAAEENELDLLEVEHEAKERYDAQSPYQSVLSAQYRIFHHYFNPPQYNWGSGDQWPADRDQRPDKIHVTYNVIRPFLTVGARLEAILPRVTIPTTTMPMEERRRAEAAEMLLATWLDLSGWDTWMFDHSLSKAIYGKGVLKPFWNDREKRGDVYVIESPWNLRIGYGASDFHTMDWAIYEYALSVREVKRRWPHLHIDHDADRVPPIHVSRYTSSEDVLQQRRANEVVPYREPSEYEKRHARVWDYWWREGDDVWNAILVEGCVAEGPIRHREMLDIPYIVTEHDHEPGSPEGVSGAIDLIDLQIELNRSLSHMFQYVADNVDPAWFLTGPDAGALVDGIIPKAGQVVSAGESDIREIPKGQSTVPFTEIYRTIFDALHRQSGVPEIALGGLAGSDISGRATAVQIQSHLNRMDPRRNRMYNSLKRLMRFWVYMAEKKNPKMPVGDKKVPLADMLGGFRNFKIIAPEITPRDAQEAVTTEINKVNGRLTSLRTAMDTIGIENPESELDLIREEGMDAQLNPERAQAFAALSIQLQQLQMNAAQMQQQLQAMAPPGGAPQGDPNAAAAASQAQMQQQQYAAQPTGFEDQNQPMTQEGSPPPGNGQGPTTSTLIRGGQALNQIAFTSGG